MINFGYARPTDVAEAIRLLAGSPGAKLIAGGTNLVDLMKYNVERPSRLIDITGLPNGTYYIQVIANPENRLQETNHKNNIALRKVILGGTEGARTVQVPPHDLVDAK